MARLITGKWACFSFNPMLEVLKLRVSGPEDRHIQCRWCKPPEREVKRISGLKGRNTGAWVGPFRPESLYSPCSGGSRHRQVMCRASSPNECATSKAGGEAAINGLLASGLRSKFAIHYRRAGFSTGFSPSKIVTILPLARRSSRTCF